MTRITRSGPTSSIVARPALDALLRGATFVRERYPDSAKADATVGAMVVFNILRELDVLLGLAINEASYLWGLPLPFTKAPNAARLRVLQSHYQLDVREQIALRNLEGWRNNMSRLSSTASAPLRRTHRCADRLFPAATLYHQIGTKLGGQPKREAKNSAQ